jgi:hypothetical protein
MREQYNRPIGAKKWSIEPADGQGNPTQSIDGQAGLPMVKPEDRPMERKTTAIGKYAGGKTRWRRANQQLTTGHGQFLGEFDSRASHFIFGSLYFL